MSKQLWRGGISMTAPISAIGERLKEIRASRNLSLEETSSITGVSKPMLGQIERGQSIPTITTLWKIATGLKTPLSSFLEEQKPEYTVVDIEKEEIIIEDHSRMKAYPIFTYDPIRNVEIFYIEFDVGCCHSSDKHNDGVEEYILVQTGKLQLILNGQELIVGEKQAIRFRADIPHAYNNPFDKQCTVYNIIFYSNH
ncbi:XRE family transcriptional regulator [uncultured Bacteroides sp.]|uniref:helix-turn-helix domain-containing protein n=1 Tax=uncultured Bacteroides sp. TaxID=162156 RepID=UPI002623C493|nr:XRE family transcriptional regulator [uncultured Bacteroides sp.]